MKKYIYLLLIFTLSTITYSIAQENIVINKSEVIEKINGKEYYIHFVKKGQTLYSISKAYDVSIDKIIKENPESAAEIKIGQLLKIPLIKEKPKSNISEANVKEKFIYHKVKKKETLYSISKRYSVTINDLMKLNPDLLNGLKEGQVIRIPERVNFLENRTNISLRKDTVKNFILYKVKKKETFYGLSKKYSVTIGEILSLNPELKEGLKKGELIKIPIKEKPEGNESLNSQRKNIKIYGDTIVNYVKHKVRRRENIFSIARDYSVSVDDIIKANPELKQGKRLRKRQIILIPVKVWKFRIPISKDSLDILKKKESSENNLLKYCNEFQPPDSVYNVALMLPFYLEETDSINIGNALKLKAPSYYRSFSFIEFYEGALFAVDSLQKRGFSTKLFVYDVAQDTSKTKMLLQKPELSKMDLIIGPLYRNSFTLVSDFAKAHGIKIVNPFSRRKVILKNNPFVFKVQPSIKTQLHQVANFIHDYYPDSSKVFIIRHHLDKGTKIDTRLKYELYDALKYDCPYDFPFTELIYEQDSIKGFIDNASVSNENIVIPLTNDKVFALNILTKLNELKDTFNISVIGIPRWDKFVGMETKYLMNLKVHIFSPSFIDYDDEDVKKFISKFRSRYKTEPDSYAFDGYDITFYFLSALMKYGKGFERCIPYLKINSLQTKFHFENTGVNDGFENSYWNIYECKNYKLIDVNHPD